MRQSTSRALDTDAAKLLASAARVGREEWAAHASTHKLRDGSPAKVMIVDDATISLRLLQTFLEDAGYSDFVTTNRSTEAVALLLAERPDVVLLDLNMPVVSGFDILAEVRAHPEVCHVPILILTASDDAGTKLKALELGATDFLAKPVDTSELALRLRNTLAAKAYQDRLSNYDVLTDLPNRRMFIDRFSDCLAHVRREGESGALLHVDLDRFRHLNDSIGHGAGDRILRTISRRIVGCLREADEICRTKPLAGGGMASRIGGDEFVVLLPRVEDSDTATRVAERVREHISEPIAWGDGELVVTPSIGIVLFPEQADGVEALLRDVALATGQAKQLGRNRYALFSAQGETGSTAQLSFENDLRRALTRDELRLHFQPKVDVVSGRIVGAEALLRWEHPHRGLVSPVEFIPLAEETGLILPFGSWVIQTACSQLAQWKRDGWHDLGVSVNVASLQLKDGNLLGEVCKALEATGIEPARLTLELTESAVIENARENIEALTAIRKLGVRLSLDDFGTGYSSLCYLEQLPIDELKIDRSFVAKVDAEGDEAPIVSAVISLARRLGLLVVAEGVEKEVQRDFLERHHCDLFQGYMFAPPLPPGEFLERLRLEAARPSPGTRSAGTVGAAATLPAAACLQHDALPGGSNGVLVIDDDPAVAEIVRSLLADFEIPVAMAYTGVDGLALVRARRFELILLDVGLPDTDGYSLCAKLRSEPAVVGVPILFLTAHDSVEDESRGLIAGAADFIRKPIHAAVLTARVRTQLALKRQRDVLARMCNTDGLTGVLNRRGLDEALEHALTELPHELELLSIAVVDVDDFKAYNDAYGHLAGDERLKDVARHLEHAAAPHRGVVGRYGGDEFVVIFPGVDLATASAAVAEAQRNIMHGRGEDGGPVFPAPLTVCVGLKSVDGSVIITARALLEEADELMLTKKKNGKEKAENATVIGCVEAPQDRACS